MSTDNLTSGQRWYRFEYLQSDHWKRTREAALQRADHRCQVCNSSWETLDVHHRTYERVGHELPEDLLVLCRTCHDLFERNGRLKPPPSYLSGPYSRSTRYIAPSGPLAAPPAITSPAILVPTEPSEPSRPHQPSALAVFGSFIAILIAYWGATVFAYLYPADEETGVELAAASYLGAKLLIGWWAVRDKCSDPGSSLIKKAFVFLLPFLPIGSWFGTFYAARGIVRAHQAWPALMALAGVVAFVLSAYIPPRLPPVMAVQPLATERPATQVPPPTVRPRTATPRPPPTATRRPTQRPSATPGCRLATTITLRDQGRRLCVYGNVRTWYENGPAYIFEFSRARNGFLLVSYDWFWPDLRAGDCVLARGKIESLGDNPVMVISDLYHCE